VVLPALNAPALLAVDYPGPDVPPGASNALTGSSVSTAVASAAAGLVWAYAPALSAEEVIATLHASGQPLATGAGEVDPFFFDGAPSPTRISVKCAVNAWQHPGTRCAPTPASTSLPALTPAELLAYPSYDPQKDTLRQPISIAGNGIARPLLAVPPPWVAPQPDLGGCGSTNCGHRAARYVDVPVPSDYNGPGPSAAAELRLYDVHGKLLPYTGGHLHLPASGLFPEGHLVQEVPPAAGAAMATITFTVAVQNPAPGTAPKRKTTQTILFSP
jgi:hypothetical protein